MTACIIGMVSEGNDLATLAVSIVFLFVGDLVFERRPFFGRAF